jgi:hypothetical protein
LHLGCRHANGRTTVRKHTVPRAVGMRRHAPVSAHCPGWMLKPQVSA